MLRNDKPRSQMAAKCVPVPNKMVKELREEIKHLCFENKELVHQNASLKALLSGREAKWKREKECMQGEQCERLNQKLRAELKEVKRELWLRQRDLSYLNASLQSQQAETLKISRDLKQRCNHVTEMEFSVKQREQVINRVVHEKFALDEQNKELTAKLNAMAAKVLQNESEINTLKNNLSCEQAEKETSFLKIQELLVTEKNWVRKHHEMEDAIIHKDQVILSVEASNQELKAKLQTMESEILHNTTEWQRKVDTLEDKIKCEQTEKEAVLLKIKELEKLFSETEQMREAKHEADVKLLTLKQIMLQEIALMTDKDKAKMEKKQKEQRKEAEKRLKKEQKEKKKQEKREKLDREKEEKRQKK